MIAACTIVGRNALADARVTATSFRARHPEIPFFTLLSDDPAGLFEPRHEPFEAVSLADLALADLEPLRFSYPQPDLSYALTPRLLTYLLDRGFARILFLKQESWVVGELRSLFERLTRSTILLTPHLLAPLDDSVGASSSAAREREVLLAGAYNCGVLGVAESTEARAFLSWWTERLERHCERAIEAGIHFEQRWLDLVPSLFRGSAIDRRPGSNVGHWRMPEARLELCDGGFRVEGDELRVARFSGYDPERPEFLTRHHERVRVADLDPAGLALITRYRSTLMAADHARCRAWPSGSSRFDDGAEVPSLVRRIYRLLPASQSAAFGDPHATGPQSFRQWLSEAPPAGRVARLWQHVWRERQDLQAAFPNPGVELEAFSRWSRDHGREEMGLMAAAWLE